MLKLAEYVLEAMGVTLPPGTEIDAGGWMVFAIYLSMGRHHDYTEALSRITADTLVVHGGKDLVPAAASRRYADLIPGAELVEVPDADHFFLQEHADLYQRVDRFLRDAVPPRTGRPPGP